MIKVKIFRDKNKNIVGYTVKGHAGYAEPGNDIVCAAISALTQTALISLNEVCGIDEESIEYTINDKKGYLSVKITQDIDNEKKYKANIVLETMYVGIKALELDYSEYITLEYGEV